MCRPGARDFELMTPDAFDIYGIVVKEEVLLRAVEREGRALNLALLEQAPRLTVELQRLDQVHYLLERDNRAALSALLIIPPTSVWLSHSFFCARQVCPNRATHNIHVIAPDSNKRSRRATYAP